MKPSQSLDYAVPGSDRIDPDRGRGPLRLLVTGGSGVLGRALRPIAADREYLLHAPGRTQLDLYDPAAVATEMQGVDAVLHLATRIQPLDQVTNPGAWHENDRLRAEASRILADAALSAGVTVFVQPTVTFVYPADGPATESTPVGEVWPTLRSALAAEQEASRFARASGRRGVVLRLGLLDGPGTGQQRPLPDFGATLHVADAARALLSALTVPSGIYNVCRDNERVANEHFKRAAHWHPLH